MKAKLVHWAGLASLVAWCFGIYLRKKVSAMLMADTWITILLGLLLLAFWLSLALICYELFLKL